MEHAPFTHSEQPLSQLKDRMAELDRLCDIPRKPERLKQIQDEMSCIALEFWWRQQNGVYE